MRKLVSRVVNFLDEVVFIDLLVSIAFMFITALIKATNGTSAWLFDFVPFVFFCTLCFALIPFTIRVLYAFINALVLTIKEKL